MMFTSTILLPSSCAARRCVEGHVRRTLLRGLSTNLNIPKATSGSSILDDTDAPLSKQPFVKTPIEPGEWDPQRKNPLYRPKFRSTARIVSADDFANRPKVGLSEEFESMQDAMVTMSWLDQNSHSLVYQMYLELMVTAESTTNGRTSHEYVMRVIAQRFNITADRVAAIVQLQHNEQQLLIQNPDIELCYDLADQMDREIKELIDEAYQTFNMKPPASFVEDPVGCADLQPSKRWVIADDVFDVDQMAENAAVREETEARAIIDGHVYIEDVDAESIPVPLDKDCKHLLKQKEVIKKKLNEDYSRVQAERTKKTAIEPEWRKTNGKGETRARYKFIAQTVNTRQLKKARAKHRSYINNNPVNTLVEHNGELRAGNMADMKSLSWKAIRNDHEHMYSGAKQGWLDRMNRNATKSWGKAQIRVPRLQQPVDFLSPEASSDTSPGTLDDILGADAASLEASDTSSDVTTDSKAATEEQPSISGDDSQVPKSAEEKDTSKDDNKPTK